jgi:RNA polymerase sigma-70 factor (ECF subfamily)
MPKAEDFDQFYATTSGRLVGQLFAMTGDLHDAQDAVQEAYIRAWQRWPRIQEYHDREAWIRTVAYRISVNAWSKARNRLTAHHRASRQAEPPEISPDLLTLVNALRKIAEPQRRVIVLHYLVGLSIEEIAAETGAPAGTVKARLARGRKALAPLVSDREEPPSPSIRPAQQSTEATAHA